MPVMSQHGKVPVHTSVGVSPSLGGGSRELLDNIRLAPKSLW